MASIDIKNASVSYFLQRKAEKKDGKLEQGAEGAQLIQRRRYVEIAALKNISLTISEGDRVGLIGLNGSGKSTLLKLCAGALAVQAGSVTVEGRVTAQFSLGSGIRSPLSGRRNAELKCLYMGTPQRSIPQRVEEIKVLSGLGGFFELPVSTYSAGMRSRLVMSLLRLVKPEILIMDEWVGAADQTVTKTADALQRKLIESASILIMASHSRRVLSQWANKLVWLDGGQVRASGPVKDVHAKYDDWVKAH
jgi:ABC-type polysaccharide/polyol phosphate transport system ATPase subunit